MLHGSFREILSTAVQKNDTLWCYGLLYRWWNFKHCMKYSHTMGASQVAVKWHNSSQ